MSPFAPKPETEALKAQWKAKLDEMRQLLPEERETHINHIAGERTYTIYTDNPSVAWRLLKAGYTPRPGAGEVGLHFDFGVDAGPIRMKTLLLG